MLNLSCPNCAKRIAIPPTAEGKSAVLFEPIRLLRCPTCDRQLTLFVERTFRGNIELRLVDPAAEWTADEILRQEG